MCQKHRRRRTVTLNPCIICLHHIELATSARILYAKYNNTNDCIAIDREKVKTVSFTQSQILYSMGRGHAPVTQQVSFWPTWTACKYTRCTKPFVTVVFEEFEEFHSRINVFLFDHFFFGRGLFEFNRFFFKTFGLTALYPPSFYLICRKRFFQTWTFYFFITVKRLCVRSIYSHSYVDKTMFQNLLTMFLSPHSAIYNVCVNKKMGYFMTYEYFRKNKKWYFFNIVELIYINYYNF